MSFESFYHFIMKTLKIANAEFLTAWKFLNAADFSVKIATQQV